MARHWFWLLQHEVGEVICPHFKARTWHRQGTPCPANGVGSGSSLLVACTDTESAGTPAQIPRDFRDPLPPLQRSGQHCGAALPWSSDFRASFTLTEAEKTDPVLPGARPRLVHPFHRGSDPACSVPGRTRPLFANTMLEWAEGTRGARSLLWAIITHFNLGNVLSYLQFLKNVLGNSQN